jgi:hypothetical protein
MEGVGHSAALRVLKSELRLFEKTAEPLHLAHAQRALEELISDVKMGVPSTTRHGRNFGQ